MMRKTFVILFFILYPILVLTAQSEKGKKQAISTIQYDSTANFLGKKAMAYTGQELYLKGLDKASQSFGYSGFILQYKKDDELLNDDKNIYKPNENYNSRYEDLAGKYFNVLEVIEHPKAKGDKEYSNDFYLKLQELSSGDIVYYKYDSNAEYTFPFIVRGFLEKQRQLLAGKEYVISDNLLKMSRDLVIGKAVNFKTGQTWKCADLTIDNTNNEISLVLQSSNGSKTAIPYSNLDAGEAIKQIYTAEEAAKLQKQFNVNNFRRILQNKVRVGMTKEMLELAWGRPTEVVEKGNTEIWSYPAGKLTIRGNKIISTK